MTARLMISGPNNESLDYLDYVFKNCNINQIEKVDISITWHDDRYHISFKPEIVLKGRETTFHHVRGVHVLKDEIDRYPVLELWIKQNRK